MILTCSDIQVAFGADPVLLGISFGIRRGEKLALAGANGTGKTTLLRVITGELKPDSGSVTRSDALRIGYLAQMQHEADDRLIYEYLRDARRASFDDEARLRDLESEMRHAEGEALDSLMRDYTALQERYEQSDGFRAESDVLGVFRGLGFEDADKERRIGTLSGGQKTRVALGRLLLTEPDLLLLDEPTNHLDLKSVQFLEQFLTSYKGAVLLVSHDRYFLDRVVTRVIEIERGRALSFEGNYTQYSQKKAAYRSAELRAYEKQQDEIRHQEAVIAKLRQYNREKSIRRAESREKKLQNMQLVEAPGSEAKQMRLVLSPRRESGQDVLDVDRIGKSFDGAPLFSSQSFNIRRGERVALIGANGTGKTTLLRIIAGLLDPDEGSIRLGTNVHCGYFDQEHRNLDPQKDIFSQIQDRYPTLTAGQIRNTLAAFLFTGDDVFQTIGSLSGGEQGRVALAQLMLSEANFLLLDEPTNHLDVPSKEILEEALNAYSGTVLYVSHDRYFINQTATRVLSLEDGQFISYIGNYDDYLSAREKRLDVPGRSDDADSGKQPASEARQSWEAAKKQQAEVRKRENAIAKLEEAIAANEARIAEIDAELSLPETGTDLALCQSLSSEQQTLTEELEALYEQWEAIASQN